MVTMIGVLIPPEVVDFIDILIGGVTCADDDEVTRVDGVFSVTLTVNGFFLTGDASAKSSSSNRVGATRFLLALPSTSVEPSSIGVVLPPEVTLLRSLSLRLVTSVGVANVIATGVAVGVETVREESGSAG